MYDLEVIFAAVEFECILQLLKNLGDVNRRVSSKQEANKRVPIVAAGGIRIRVGA